MPLEWDPQDLVAAIAARLTAAGAANVHEERMTPCRDSELPAYNVFLSSDSGKAEGDPRTGLPRFEHGARITVEVEDKVAGLDGKALKHKLRLHAQAIQAALLTDLSWGGDIVEGIASLGRVYDMPPEGASLIGRVQIQMEVLWRSSFAPDISGLTDFASLRADTGGGIGADLVVPTE